MDVWRRVRWLPVTAVCAAVAAVLVAFLMDRPLAAVTLAVVAVALAVLALPGSE